MELPAHPEPDAAWREIRTGLRDAAGDADYDIWLAPLELLACDGSVLRLKAPPGTQAWVAKRFGGLITSSAQEVIGGQARVSFGGGPNGERGSGDRRELGAGREASFPPRGLNPRLSFDQFIIGDGNRLAHAAALAVAELPGQAYNPLFLHAPPGLGKTHLLQAIGNYVLHFGAAAKVRYATVEGFTNDFIAALGNKSLEHFKQLYREADLLLIDDVQFLASKVKTEEEFFHTFNALHENGRQLVLTCDRLPHQLVGIEERLRERFEAGLVADIRPPDFATRLTILRKRARLDGLALAQSDVLELIAERIVDNVRALEGALIRIVAHHSLTGHPIDVELARQVLDDMYPTAGRTPGITIALIQQVVAGRFHVSVSELCSSSRVARFAWPRQVAIHLARELTTESLQTIGQAFGGRNHATVLHSCQRVSDRLAADPDVQQDLRELASELTSSSADRNG